MILNYPQFHSNIAGREVSLELYNHFLLAFPVNKRVDFLDLDLELLLKGFLDFRLCGLKIVQFEDQLVLALYKSNRLFACNRVIHQ